MELIGGRFRIECLAGQGGFGDVYRGFDERMERPVAIKYVYKVGEHEAEVMRNLRNPGLPELYDILNSDGQTIIVMEWIEGQTLENLINEKGAIQEARAYAIGLELLNILDYLHSRRPAIIYQDLKPANIMMTPAGHIKLIDFGTALIRDHSDEVKRLAGTVGYGAPEQRGITGMQHADTYSDIYAWGAVMYSLVSGQILSKPPYTMQKIRLVAPNISFGMAHVISKATRRDVKKRYSSVQEVRRSLDSSVCRDFLCRFVYMLLACAIVCPFAYAWYEGWKSGLYDYIAMNGLNIKVGLAGLTDEYFRLLGMLISTAGGMLFGLRKIHMRRFIRIDRSEYLSDRRYPGLWIVACILGIVLGAALGERNGMKVSYAAENISILPIRFVDENGNNMLVRYDAPFTAKGDMTIRLDREIVDGLGDGYLTIFWTDLAGHSGPSRRIEVRQ